MNTTTFRNFGLAVTAVAFAVSSFAVSPAEAAKGSHWHAIHSTHANSTANANASAIKAHADKRLVRTPPTHRPPTPRVHGGTYKSYP